MEPFSRFSRYALLIALSGTLVGIDFGYAFGSATQLLPVPELVPFRLTRQLTSCMLPLATDGAESST